MNKMSAKKVKSEAENEEIVMNKLGLSWAKLSPVGVIFSKRLCLVRAYSHGCHEGVLGSPLESELSFMPPWKIF